MTEVEVKLQAVKLERKSKWIRVALKLYHCGGRGAVGTQSAGRWVDLTDRYDVVEKRRLLVGDNNRIPVVQSGERFHAPTNTSSSEVTSSSSSTLYVIRQCIPSVGDTTSLNNCQIHLIQKVSDKHLMPDRTLQYDM